MARDLEVSFRFFADLVAARCFAARAPIADRGLGWLVLPGEGKVEARGEHRRTRCLARRPANQIIVRLG